MSDQEGHGDFVDEIVGDVDYSEELQLPSRGILYDGKVPEGRVVVRPITTDEEKLLVQVGKDKGRMLDEVIRRCIVSLPIPYEGLILSDKFYLFMFIRGVTWGFGYTFTLKCPSCGKEFSHSLKVPDDLRLRVLNEDDAEPIMVCLPMCKKEVGLRHLRVRDEWEIDRYVEQETRKGHADGMGDPGYIYRLAMRIVTIDGKTPNMMQAMKFCSKMHGRDSGTMNMAIEEHGCGMDLMLSVTCPGCGNRSDQQVPFTPEFFRPPSL